MRQKICFVTELPINSIKFDKFCLSVVKRAHKCKRCSRTICSDCSKGKEYVSSILNDF